MHVDQVNELLSMISGMTKLLIKGQYDQVVKIERTGGVVRSVVSFFSYVYLRLKLILLSK